MSATFSFFFIHLFFNSCVGHRFVRHLCLRNLLFEIEIIKGTASGKAFAPPGGCSLGVGVSLPPVHSQLHAVVVAVVVVVAVAVALVVAVVVAAVVVAVVMKIFLDNVMKTNKRLYLNRKRTRAK